MYIQYKCSYFLRLPFTLHTVVLCIDKHKMTFITPIEVFSQINWLQSQKSWLSLQLLFHLFHITPQGIITALWVKIIYRNITENFGISCQLLVNTILTFLCINTRFTSLLKILTEKDIFFIFPKVLSLINKKS